jgi:8-oxo-dGTP pyrophosphatase MutT (NUDIX family)
MSEALCRVGVVALIRDAEGRLLMEQRTVPDEPRGVWSFIAGGKKAGESVVDAARREVAEEVAAEFKPDDLVGVVDHHDQRSDDTSWTVVGLRGTIRGEPTNNEPGKRARIAWKETPPPDLHPTSEMMWEVYRSERYHPEL